MSMLCIASNVHGGHCTCGGQHDVEEFFQFQYLMSFLMGLNDSFAQTRAQILFTYPPPSISKVFFIYCRKKSNNIPYQFFSHLLHALVVQHPSHSAPSSTSNSSNSRFLKDCAVCTHCGIQDHTIDRCYKIHGYPPDLSTQSSENFYFSVLYITIYFCLNLVVAMPSTGSSIVPPRTFDAITQFFTMLQSQLNVAKFDYEASSSYRVGTSQCFFSPNSWILDLVPLLIYAFHEIYLIHRSLLRPMLFYLMVVVYQFILLGLLHCSTLSFFNMFCLSPSFSIICYQSYLDQGHLCLCYFLY